MITKITSILLLFNNLFSLVFAQELLINCKKDSINIGIRVLTACGSIDFDNDGVFDLCDLDDDNDGVPDGDEGNPVKVIDPLISPEIDVSLFMT